MNGYFRRIIKNLTASQMIPFWILVVCLIIEIIFNFWWVPKPLGYILSAILVLVFFWLMPVVVNLINRYRQSETERRQIMAMLFSINDAAIAYSRDFEIIMFNAAAEKLCQLKRSEVLHRQITPELATDKKFGFLAQIIFPSLASFVLKKSLDAYPQKIEIKFLEPQEKILEITTTQVLDEEGNHYGFLKIIRDKTRETTLLKMKSDFITITAHQLRTPLSGLNWALEMLNKKEAGSLTPEQEAIVHQAFNAAQGMAKSVNALLDVSQMEEGRFGYKFEPANLEEIITSVLSELESNAQEKSVKLYFEKPSQKLNNIVMDAIRIKTVLEILVDNAIKYNVLNGEVRVKISFLSDRPFIKVSVADTGLGINPRDLNRLFTKFFRGENASKLETAGLGLGLYIAKNIIQRHGGEMDVQSIEKRGSIFSFTLPLDPAYIPPLDLTAEEIL